MRTKFPHKPDDNTKQFQSMWIPTNKKIPPRKPIKIVVWDRFTGTALIIGSEYIHDQLKKALAKQKKEGRKNHTYFVSHWMHYHPPTTVMKFD